MTDNEQTEIVPEVVSGNALERIERATVDVQIATAHQYPRSMTLFKKRALEMCTLDEETAQSCIYRRPVGKKDNKVEYAEGKSIRMAEIIGASYGNLRVGAILVEQTPRYVKARGMAHDLESNFAASSEVVESTVDRYGNPYSERMRMVVAKATLAKARRDATFQVVPGALCKSMEEAARTTAIGTTATLGKRRAVLMDWINKLGVEPKRVFGAIGVNGVDDIGLEQLETLTGIKTAIKDGDTTIDEAFPINGPTEAPTSRTEQMASKLKKQAPAEAPPAQEKTAPATPPPEPPDQPDAGGPTDSEGRPLEESKPKGKEHPVAVVSLGAVLTKPTKTGGTKWSAQGDDGEWYATFDKGDAETMQALAGTPKKARIAYKETRFGRDIVSISPAEGQQ